jgi:hypothetical protein
MDETSHNAPQNYQPPRLRALGTVAELTQTFDKRWGGSDGWQFIGIDVPIHTVSP